MARDQLFETSRRSRRSTRRAAWRPRSTTPEDALAPHGTPRQDAAGNIVLALRGAASRAGRPLAHKDEIGGLVKRVEENGRLIAQTLGDAHPWIWGEGPVEIARPPSHRAGGDVVRLAARSDESPQRSSSTTRR